MRLILTAIAYSTFTFSVHAQDIYSGNQCWNKMNHDTIISEEMNAKVRATNTKNFLSSIGRMTMTSAVANHRSEQCRLKKSGMPFEQECPVSKSIHIDNHVQAAIDYHALKTEAALMEQLAVVKSEVTASISAMMDTCK